MKIHNFVLNAFTRKLHETNFNYVVKFNMKKKMASIYRMKKLLNTLTISLLNNTEKDIFLQSKPNPTQQQDLSSFYPFHKNPHFPVYSDNQVYVKDDLQPDFSTLSIQNRNPQQPLTSISIEGGIKQRPIVTKNCTSRKLS